MATTWRSISKSKAYAMAMRRSRRPRTQRSTRSAQKRQQPLGQPGKILPLDCRAADPRAGNDRPDHGGTAEKTERHSGVLAAQVAGPDDPCAGDPAPDMARIRSA